MVVKNIYHESQVIPEKEYSHIQKQQAPYGRRAKLIVGSDSRSPEKYAI